MMRKFCDEEILSGLPLPSDVHKGFIVAQELSKELYCNAHSYQGAGNDTYNYIDIVAENVSSQCYGDNGKGQHDKPELKMPFAGQGTSFYHFINRHLLHIDFPQPRM